MAKVFDLMMFELAPLPPYWPAYPEPERSRLEEAYRAEHAAYMRRIDRQLIIEMVAVASTFIAGGVLIAWELLYA
jgi:hypothetical protein